MNVSLSAIFSNTFSVLSFSLNAPVGQDSIHCPQNVQSTSFRLKSPAVEIADSKPLFVDSIAPISCTLLQVDTHLLHKIHLFISLIIDGDLSSSGAVTLAPLYFISLMLYFLANACSSQLPLLTQVRQSFEWLDRIKSNTIFLDSTTCGE